MNERRAFDFTVPKQSLHFYTIEHIFSANEILKANEKSEWNKIHSIDRVKSIEETKNNNTASRSNHKKNETWIINTYSVDSTWIPYCVFITIDLVALCKNALVLPPSLPISDCNDYFCRSLNRRHAKHNIHANIHRDFDCVHDSNPYCRQNTSANMGKKRIKTKWQKRNKLFLSKRRKRFVWIVSIYEKIPFTTYTSLHIQRQNTAQNYKQNCR